MKKFFFGFCFVLFLLVVIGTVINANKSPEEKAADEERYKKAASIRKADAEKERQEKLLKEIISPSKDILEFAYIENVKSKDSLFIKCSEINKYEHRFFYECGESYGNSELANKGVWEAAASEDGQLVLYAMNGKALRALEKIGESKEFRSGQGRVSAESEK